MIRVKYVETLERTKELLKDYEGKIITAKDLKNLKKTSKEKTCSLDTLRKLKVLELSHKEKIEITLPQIIEINEVFVNGQKLEKNLENYEIQQLKRLGLDVKVNTKKSDKIQVLKYYYKVSVGKIDTKLKKQLKENKKDIKRKVAKLENELKTYTKLLTMCQ